MPVRASALGAAVVALTLLACMGYVRRPSALRAALVLAPPALFTLWIIALPTPGAPGFEGGHAFNGGVTFTAWSVIALIGLGLARIAERPLALREAAAAWTFLAPSFVHLLIFSIGPILFALWLSFHEWNLLDPARSFVGLANYRELARDTDFWRAVRNTAVYVLFVPAGMIVALALALFVNRRIPGVRFLRTVLFLPYITSFVAISLVWRWMFQPDVGLFNHLLGWIGVSPLPWLSSPATALPSLMLMSLWMYAGYMMVVFLAGLQNIPQALYESARIDGAGAWQRFRHITLPMLRPTMLFVLVTMVIFMFQVFTAVYVMTEGGPLHATDVVVYHVYRAAWEYLRMGYASAMAWVLFAIVFVITLIQFRFLGDRTGVAS
jgi:multiple sugar transport system permease protein